MYQIIKYENDRSVIRRVEDEAYVPTDPENTDYQRYLAWLAEGNEPEVIV